MRRFVLSLMLLAMTVTSFALSELVVYDADGDRAGVFVQYDGGWIVVRTADGYLMRIDPRGGHVFYPCTGPAGAPVTDWDPGYGFYFTDEDCTGQAYLGVSVISEGWLDKRGGEIFWPSCTIVSGQNQLGRVEWAASAQEITPTKQGLPGACGNAAAEPVNVVPVTIIDPADYNMEIDLSRAGTGFQPPLSFVTEQANVIFCNGLENCPAE